LKRIFIILVASFLFTGCVWIVAAGSTGTMGAFAWHDGNLARNYGEPIPITFEATLNACKLQGLNVTSAELYSHRGRVIVKNSNDETIRIFLEKWTEFETRITVRVGLLGDIDLSRQIHSEVANSLR